MNYMQAEFLEEFPTEVDTEVTEIPHYKPESYSSKELAAKFGVTDRTVRNWITELRNEVFYWCPTRLVAGERYSQFCFEQLQRYNEEVRLGKKDFAQFKQEILIEFGQISNHRNVVAIALSKDNREYLATQKVTETKTIVNQSQNKFNSLRQLMRTNLQRQARKDAAEDAGIYVQTYTETLADAMSGVENISSEK